HLELLRVEVALTGDRDLGAHGNRAFLEACGLRARRRREGEIPHLAFLVLDLHRRVGALEAYGLRDRALQREVLGALSGPAVVGERARGDREAEDCSAKTVDDLALHGSLLGLQRVLRTCSDDTTRWRARREAPLAAQMPISPRA